MTAQPIQPEQPADHDWLDVAEAVGVTRAPEPLHPVLRGVLSDVNLAAVVSAWATAYAAPACGTCQETGLVEDRHWRTGETFHRTCPDCQGDGGDVR